MLKMMSERHTRSTSEVIDPDTWVDEHGEPLFRYALFRVQNVQVAEDLVQETFLAALRGKDAFAGRSSIRTWLFGILKHKILDYFRSVGRERITQNIETMANLLVKDFDEQRGWKYQPAQWTTDPSLLFQQQEFWKILQECMLKLPPRLHQAFTLRELDGLSGKEVCKILNVTGTNEGVMLHRARQILRRCVAVSWCERETAS